MIGTHNHSNFPNRIETSAILTIVGIIFLFSFAIIITLIAPSYVDPSWTQPSTPFQVQMYEIADPNIYITSTPENEKQVVYHLQDGFTLLAFRESDTTRIISPPDLDKYITRMDDQKLKLTSRLMLLRKPEISPTFNAEEIATKIKKQLVEKWQKDNPNAKEKGDPRPDYEVLELFVPDGNSAFSRSTTDGIIENWVDADYDILDDQLKQPYHKDPGVIYVNNPQEYKISLSELGGRRIWRYSPTGKKISSIEDLKSPALGFMSRQELIRTGEHIYAIEGCWYCHTDQTRTLIQDVVLNGSDSFPAPPSSANEYIYQNITFPGTRRIGPDLSRVGVKRPSRDWHRGHFWSPKTASHGSIMPSFQHFFDFDPRGTGERTVNQPNYKFEAIFQYLMTKGTRITPPTQAWWLGKDPVKTKEIIEGLRTIPK